MNAITRLKEDKIAIYMCTFQLQLSRLDMILKFPCSFFIQWKTSNNTKCVRTSKVNEAIKNQVLFDETLSLQTEMIYDQQKKRWIRKNTVICVNVITKSRPDQIKQAGRICIDLVDIIQKKKYLKLEAWPLTYSSINANLTFLMNLKYSLRIQMSPSKLDLTSFADFINIQQSTLTKSKSLDFLKKQKVQHLQRIESVGEIQENERQQKIELTKKNINIINDFQNVKQCESSEEDQNSSQNNLRMTLGTSSSAAKINYNLLIEKQTVGMKKSDLMVIPNLSTPRDKSQHQSSEASQISESQFNHQKVIDKKSYKTNLNLNSEESINQVKSKNKLQRLDSMVDVAYDEESSPSYPSMNKHFMNHSNNSIESSSIKNTKIQKVSIKVNQKDQIENKNKRIKELQNDMSQLVKLITNVNEQLSEQVRNKNLFYSQLEITKKKNIDLMQKLTYEQKINNMNLQKIKQLTNKFEKIENQKQINKRRLSNIDQLKLISQLQEQKNKCKTLSANYQLLKKKLDKRDEIQLQNQQKIIILKQENQNLKIQLQQIQTQKPYSSIQSPKSAKFKVQVIKLQGKIQYLQKQNLKMQSKSQLYKKMIQEFMEKENRMKENIQIIENQFIRLAKSYKALQLNNFQTKYKKDDISIIHRENNQLSFSTEQMKTILKLKQFQCLNAGNIQNIKTLNQFKIWILAQIQQLNSYIEQLVKQKNKTKQQLIQKQHNFLNQLKVIKERNKQLSEQLHLQKKSDGQGSTAFYPQYSGNFQYLSPQVQKIQLYSQTTTKKPPVGLANGKKITQNQLQRQIQKLKSIIYDKSKEMSDLTASYQKIKLQNQKQAVVIKNYKQQISMLSSSDLKQKKWLQTLSVQNQREEEFVHDILDLQLKLNKQKFQKSQIQQELSVRKSLNRSQQISHLKDYCNGSGSEGLTIYKEIQNLLKQRNQSEFQNRIRQIVQNQCTIKKKLQLIQDGCQIKYIVQQKARNISKQLQKVKSSLIKMKISQLQNKSLFVNILKPCQIAVTDLLSAIQNLVNHPSD